MWALWVQWAARPDHPRTMMIHPSNLGPCLSFSRHHNIICLGKEEASARKIEPIIGATSIFPARTYCFPLVAMVHGLQSCSHHTRLTPSLADPIIKHHENVFFFSIFEKLTLIETVEFWGHHLFISSVRITTVSMTFWNPRSSELSVLETERARCF